MSRDSAWRERAEAAATAGLTREDADERLRQLVGEKALGQLAEILLDEVSNVVRLQTLEVHRF